MQCIAEEGIAEEGIAEDGIAEEGGTTVPASKIHSLSL